MTLGLVWGWDSPYCLAGEYEFNPFQTGNMLKYYLLSFSAIFLLLLTSSAQADNAVGTFMGQVRT